MKTYIFLIALLFIISSSSFSQIMFTDSLDGSQETPAVMTNALGTAWLVLRSVPRNARGMDRPPGRRSSARRRSGSCWEYPCPGRSEEHTSELQSLRHLVCRLL